MACSGQNLKKRLTSTIYLWDVPQVRCMWCKELGRVVIAMFENAIKALRRDRGRSPRNRRHPVARRKSLTLRGHRKVSFEEIKITKSIEMQLDVIYNVCFSFINPYLKVKFSISYKSIQLYPVKNESSFTQL